MGRNQMMTKRLKAAIEDEMIEALRYAPAEDKLQLGLDTIGMACVDSKADSSRLLADARDIIDDLSNTVTSLQAQLAKKQVAGKTP
tara:strand:- start:382 stop:639 length:258 start_codon:yes stop_codon:yes gene_type:complete